MILIGFVLGIVLGSFIKVIADRSLTNNWKITGRSYCPKCKNTLHWYDLIPVLSFILLSGKCRYCHKKIGLSYPLTELCTGLLIAYLFFVSPLPLSPFPFPLFIADLLFKVFFICILVALTITDLKKMLIPDKIVLPSIIVAFVYLLISSIAKIGYIYYYLSQTALGRYLLPPYTDYFQRHAFITIEPFLLSILMGLAIGGFFLSLIIITRGKGMGGGDVKLGAFLGLVLGFPNSLVALMVAFISGSVVSLFLIALRKKSFGQYIPFGPFLVLGSLTALFWGGRIVDWYLHLSI